ncbi:hypothetical protein BGW80DRAFT_766237 [Lactifluus volemus]|nr:hypothetical protein BGW80DRAFT_766237 [Lactifluus volemus]
MLITEHFVKRVQSVEAELAQLRPVLLMQPYAVTHSIPPSHNHYWHNSTQKADTTRRMKRRKNGDADQDVTEEEPDNTVMALSTPRTRPRGDYYRRRDTEPFGDNSRHRKRTQKKGSATLADARAEHMLLAARKLGRERASILAVSGSAASRDKIKNDGDQAEVAPKTPRKQQTVRVGNGSSTGVIYLNSPIPALADTASVEHVSSDFSPAQTPLIHRKPVRGQATPERAARPNPFTPLDSLLTAASTISMIEDKDDEDDDGDIMELDRTPSASTRGSARRLPAMSVGSPAPTKRRRLASSRPGRSLAPSVTTPDRKGPPGGTGRTRSALDVLADQAAVFSSQDHDRAPSRDRAKGKGKAKEPDKRDTDVDPDEGPSPSLAIGDESGRQKPHMPNQAPSPRQRAATPQLRSSASTLSLSSRPASVTGRGHDPPSQRASEIQRLSPSPERAPLG